MNTTPTSHTAFSGIVLAVCGCCTDHNDLPLDWTVVTCRECGAACSCPGCVAESEAT